MCGQSLTMVIMIIIVAVNNIETKFMDKDF